MTGPGLACRTGRDPRPGVLVAPRERVPARFRTHPTLPRHRPSGTQHTAVIGTVMTGSQTEREMPPAQAEDRARAAVERLGLYGETEELVRVGGLAVWRCRLRDRAGRAVPHGHGAGKGRCEDARAGALFEALEHHLTGPAHFAARRMTFRPGSALAAGPLAREACAPVLRVLPRVACRTYTPLHPGGGDRLEVPAKGFVEKIDVPKADRADGVAVIGAIKREEAWFRHTVAAGVFIGKLERDLHRGRAVVGKENLAEAIFGSAAGFDQPPGQ